VRERKRIDNAYYKKTKITLKIKIKKKGKERKGKEKGKRKEIHMKLGNNQIESNCLQQIWC
jgi:hypothetical protein